MSDWIDKFRTKPDGRLDPKALEQAFQAMDERERRKRRLAVVRACDREIAAIDKERRSIQERRAILQLSIDRYEEIIPKANEWFSSVHILECPDGSAMHQLRQAIADDEVLFLGLIDKYRPEEFETALKEANCFVVEHDWDKAFHGATDFAEGEIRLPYDVCAFEFRISGSRVIALMSTIDEIVMMQLFARIAARWVIDDDIAQHINGRWEMYHSGRSTETNLFQGIVEFVGAQVRAVCIALDAEVAESEVIRAPHKFVKAREKAGKIPPLPFHTVSLARRQRHPQLAPMPSDEPKTQKRLHFRRGHWRHFETFKTWVRWTLVGNPDLGFVDKDYRL